MINMLSKEAYKCSSIQNAF